MRQIKFNILLSLLNSPWTSNLQYQRTVVPLHDNTDSTVFDLLCQILSHCTGKARKKLDSHLIFSELKYLDVQNMEAVFMVHKLIWPSLIQGDSSCLLHVLISS